MTIKRKLNNIITKVLGLTPPRKIPENLYKGFSDNNTPIEYIYFNELNFFPRLWTKKLVNDYINIAKKRNEENKKDDLLEYWTRKAIEKYVKGFEVVNIGSSAPGIEAVCILNGAKKVYTIEYRKIFSLDKRIKTMTPKDWDKNPIKFDIGLSISSFEHDGLGRYGDPINPNADIETMKKMKRTIKKDGLLFLSIPCGKEKLIWNSGRTYGRNRINKMLKGWELLDIFDYRKEKFNQDNPDDFMPIFILRNVDNPKIETIEDWESKRTSK